MLFDWFNTKEAVLIGIKLADNLSQELAKINNKNSKKDAVNKAKVVQKFFHNLMDLRGQLTSISIKNLN